MLRRVAFIVLVAVALAIPATADDYLMYGPSLAVYLETNLGCDDDRGIHQIPRSTEFTEDESHFATDAGHTVTIVSESEWTSMTTEEFAVYDAIVIGDAGCGCDDGEFLEAVDANKAVWSPAVTGHLFMHTFDNVYHYNTNSSEDRGGRGTSTEQFDGMRDLALDGIAYAASASGTGLYYAHGCRDLNSGSDRGSLEGLDFLSELSPVVADVGYGSDGVMVVEPGHPSMVNQTDASLSFWGSSTHASFDSYDGSFDLLAIGTGEEDERGGGGPRGEEGDVIIATAEPLGGANARVLAIPTAGTFGVAVLALLLGLLGWMTVARRV